MVRPNFLTYLSAWTKYNDNVSTDMIVELQSTNTYTLIVFELDTRLFDKT
jgi:hypothetical protein